MAHVWYNVSKQSAAIDADNDDLRLVLLEAASDLNPDDTTVAAVLARGGTTEATNDNVVRKALTTSRTQNDTNDRADLSIDAAVTFTELGTGTLAAALIYKFSTDDAGSTPIVAIENTSWPAPNGGDWTINAGDFLRVSQSA